jgi:tetratricopeptide (TPR) repeat protein
MKMKSALIVFACLGLTFCASSQSKLARSRERDPQYQYNMGLFYLNGNSVDEAIRYLNKSLSLNPRYFLAWNALGLAQSMKGNFQEATAAFLKSLEVNSQFTEARNNLGTIYQELRFVDKAEEQFKKALEDENYASRELPYYNLANLYYSMDRIDEAYENVQKAIQIKNRLAMAHDLKGRILERKGDINGAIDSYKQAVRQVPNETSFGFNLGAAYFKNNEFEKARELLERISPLIKDQETKDKIKEYLDIIKGKSEDQVPSFQSSRYFFWAGVSLSMETPIEASFRAAISLSMAPGTG